jgi:N-acetylglutamate synthase-like GNAT family acetyltransferase
VLRVRVATADDIGVMLSLWRELEEVQGPLRYFPSSPDAEERIMRSFRAALDEDDADVLLVEEDGDALGMALVHVDTPSRMSAEQAVELMRVVVRPEKRGTGAGRALVEAADEWARQRGISTLLAAIFVANEGSKLFWSAMGFETWVERMIRPVRGS